MLGNNQFIQQRGGDGIDMKEGGKIAEIILIGRKVIDGIHATQRAKHRLGVACVGFDKLDCGIKVARLPFGVDWLLQIIQHPNMIAQLQQSVRRVRTDKTRAADNKNRSAHALTFLGRSA
ncbi:MAG: hypothetical protein UZ07_CHB004000590 [Chlorobi bacterium OLB7]|nr:MAG: hypothetical protein UZ07_CHB004000590 [Chlorobi bacterium OLB7]